MGVESESWFGSQWSLVVYDYGSDGSGALRETSSRPMLKGGFPKECSFYLTLGESR